MSETEFARAERLWSENCRLQSKLSSLEEQAQALVSAIKNINNQICTRNISLSWCQDEISKALEAYQAWKRGQS